MYHDTVIRLFLILQQFQISPFFSLRCVSLEQQTLVFNYKRYTFKCSVGSRAKVGTKLSINFNRLYYLIDSIPILFYAHALIIINWNFVNLENYF